MNNLTFLAKVSLSTLKEKYGKIGVATTKKNNKPCLATRDGQLVAWSSVDRAELLKGNFEISQVVNTDGEQFLLCHKEGRLLNDDFEEI